MNESQYPQHPQQPYGAEQPVYERPVSIGEWLRLMLVSLFAIIPFIGWIIALVIYIVKATNPSLPVSYRNAIKAGFIWLAIGIALSILLTIVVVTAMMANPIFQEAYQSAYNAASGF